MEIIYDEMCMYILRMLNDRDILNIRTLSHMHKCLWEGYKPFISLKMKKNVTDDDLQWLHGIGSIDLSGCTLITDKALAYFNGVQSIDLSDCDGIDGDGLVHIKTAKKVSLAYTLISGCSIQVLTNAKSLDLTECSVDSDCLRELTVTTINLSYCNIEDDELSYLTQVKKINISYCFHITDDGLKYLSNAKRIDLSGCNITDRGLEHLSKVEIIHLADCDGITDEGLKHLKNAKEVVLSACNNVTNDCYTILPGVKIVK
jgi:Leucine Rich repeat